MQLYFSFIALLFGMAKGGHAHAYFVISLPKKNCPAIQSLNVAILQLCCLVIWYSKIKLNVNPNGKNEAFNCNNVDVFKWKHLWKVLADKFELEYEEFDENQEYVMSLVERMKVKGAVWDEIVKKNNLTPTKLEEVATF